MEKHNVFQKQEKSLQKTSAGCVKQEGRERQACSTFFDCRVTGEGFNPGKKTRLL